jgi:hypothetical protein
MTKPCWHLFIKINNPDLPVELRSFWTLGFVDPDSLIHRDRLLLDVMSTNLLYLKGQQVYCLNEPPLTFLLKLQRLLL